MIGIYCITNTVNNKKYIGQSIDIIKRFKQHQCCCKKSHLYKSMKKYGLGAFEFSIIKVIKNTKITHLLLDAYEQFYINKYNTCNPIYGYNKQAGGSGGKPNEETKKMQSLGAKKYWDSMSLEQRKERAKNNKGKTGYRESYETRIKKSKSHIGMKMKEESKNKISQSKLGKKRNPDILKKSWETRRLRSSDESTL